MAEPEEKHRFYMRIAFDARSVVDARRLAGNATKGVVKAVLDSDIEDFTLGLYDEKGQAKAVNTYGKLAQNYPPKSIKVEEE